MNPKVRTLVPEAEGGKDKKEELSQCATTMADLEMLLRSVNNHVSSRTQNSRETSNPVKDKRSK